MTKFVSKRNKVKKKSFKFDSKAPPPSPDTPEERAAKDELIQKWLKKHKIKKLPYRRPES